MRNLVMQPGSMPILNQLWLRAVLNISSSFGVVKGQFHVYVILEISFVVSISLFLI